MRSIWVVLGLSLPLLAIAGESKQALLLACAERAAEKDLVGDARAAFMQACLALPRDQRPVVFDTGKPQITDAKSLDVRLQTDEVKSGQKQTSAAPASAKKSVTTAPNKPRPVP
jgi:psiF repeat